MLYWFSGTFVTFWSLLLLCPLFYTEGVFTEKEVVVQRDRESKKEKNERDIHTQ